MKIAQQPGFKIALAIAVLLITFALGYWAGSKNQSSRIEPSASLTNTDMEHAFGQIASATHESESGPATGEPSAKSLGDLVAGLEKKVAANPENIDQQLLLAQTYNELGNREKSLKLLHELNRNNPKNAQVKITFATVLMKGGTKSELQESIKVFDEAIKLKPDVEKMARMYQSEARSSLESSVKQK